MRKNFNTNTKNNDEWLTPPLVFQSLGDFDIDPCSPITRPWDTAKLHYNINDDGLKKQWNGRVWCNPPYGKDTFTWLNKLADHGNGIALIFARTETKGFHEQIFEKADAVFFFKGRLKFHYVDGTQGDTANAPSCLVAYGAKNVQALKDSGLKGKLIALQGIR
jgi:hypothetical protein